MSASSAQLTLTDKDHEEQNLNRAEVDEEWERLRVLGEWDEHCQPYIEMYVDGTGDERVP